MADATGVCYTQSGNVKRYEPLRMSYWAFRRIGNGTTSSGKLLAYMYICDPNEYFYSTFEDQYTGITSVSEYGKLLSYTIDSEGICHYSINPGRKDSDLNGIEHGDTILGRFYNYYNNKGNEKDQVKPSNIPTTLEGLTEGTDYICKKYSYGTEEYNELISYLIGTSFDYSGSTGGTPNITLEVKLAQGDNVESSGFNSFIKNFSNESFMPDIFVVQNYKELYLSNPTKADLPSCNIWCYGVVEGYNGAPSDNWSTTVTITVMPFEDSDNNVVGSDGTIIEKDLNLSSSQPLHVFGGDELIKLDGPILTSKKTTRTIYSNNSLNISLSTHQKTNNVSYRISNKIMLKIKIEFGKGTKWMRDSKGNLIIENESYYGIDSNFDSNGAVAKYLEEKWDLSEYDPVTPYFINTYYENTLLKPYVWNELGNSCLGAVIVHDIYDSTENGASVIAWYMLGVQQKNGTDKFYLADTDAINNYINSWTVFVESKNGMNTGAIRFSGCNIF